jgi:phosphotriesterase-related protein
MDNRKGNIQTVLGLMDSNQMGFTLTHEHLFADMTSIVPKPLRFLFGSFKKDDVDKAIGEAQLFKQVGGGTIVDATPLGTRVENMQVKLAKVSQATGVNVICGTSYYVDRMWTAEQRKKSVTEIADEYISDIENGFGDTGIKPGMIGEVGISWPMAESERKSLKAAAIASKKTGLPISIHTGYHESSPIEIVTLLLNEGVQPDRIISGHMATAFAPNRRADMLQLAKMGTYLEFDQFKTPASSFKAIKRPYWSDENCVEAIVFLVKEGYGDRILISGDMLTQAMHTYKNGPGYIYIPKTIVPMLCAKGLTDEQVQMITVKNPAKVFSIA